MEGRTAVVATLVVAVALASVPTGGLAQSGESSVTPGERFAGVVGVQEAEMHDEVESRAFRLQVDRADGEAERAAVVARQVAASRERLAELERRRDRLRERRANGTVSEGQYRARIARLVAESRSLERRLNQTAAAGSELPDAALRERGVDPAELARLRAAAGNLTGPETAAIARGIAGEGRGPPPTGPPGLASSADTGPRSDPGNVSSGGTASGSERSTNASDAGPSDRRPSDAANGTDDGADARGREAGSPSNRTATDPDAASRSTRG